MGQVKLSPKGLQQALDARRRVVISEETRERAKRDPEVRKQLELAEQYRGPQYFETQKDGTIKRISSKNFQRLRAEGKKNREAMERKVNSQPTVAIKCVIGRNGAPSFALVASWWAEWMPLLKGEKITVRYNPQDLSFRPRKISWRLVASEVNSRMGKVYAPQYIRDVASGYRSNKKLYSLLAKLGVQNFLKQMQQEASNV